MTTDENCFSLDGMIDKKRKCPKESYNYIQIFCDVLNMKYCKKCFAPVLETGLGHADWCPHSFKADPALLFPSRSALKKHKERDSGKRVADLFSSLMDPPSGASA